MPTEQKSENDTFIYEYAMIDGSMVGEKGSWVTKVFVKKGDDPFGNFPLQTKG